MKPMSIGVLSLAIAGCGDAIILKRQLVELRVRRDQVAVPGAVVKLAHQFHWRPATGALNRHGDSAATDASGFAVIRVPANTLVGGVFPIATVQCIWRDLHPPDCVTGRRFYVRVAADKETVDGEFVVERHAGATFGGFEIDVYRSAVLLTQTG